MNAQTLLLLEKIRQLENQLKLFTDKPLPPPFNGEPMEVSLPNLMPNLTIPLYASIRIADKKDGYFRAYLITADGIHFYVEHAMLTALDKAQIFDFMIEKLTQRFVTELMRELKK
jgi:hypothetical protein